jgi:CsoR family transcriptional regulator, copper-sensing transcriptional repressor
MDLGDNLLLKEDLLRRMKTVKGHVAGIEKMIDEEKECEDIILQLAAVRSSLEKVGLAILENNAYSCLAKGDDAKLEQREKFEQAVKTIIKFLK